MPTNKNETELISLITFDHAWPQRERLLFTVVLSIFGCVMNGFYVTAFFIEDYLKRIGLIFQASVGLSDMIVTMAVIPTSAVILLSGQGDSKIVCYTLQFLTEASAYNYSIFFCMMSLETFYRLCRTTEDCDVFISKHIDTIGICVFVSTFSTAAVGVYFDLDYDCCYRAHTGNLVFRITTNIVFHLIPCLITIFCAISAFLEMKHHASTHIHYRKSQQYTSDRYAHYINMFAFILYVGAWLPYLILVYGYPITSGTHFYQSVWLGVGRSVITSFLYGVLDKNFRRAFAHLFNYCFCKWAISDRMVRRDRRACEYRASTGDVRVRMIHHAINANSPRRAALCPRDTP